MTDFFSPISEAIVAAIPASDLTVSAWADTYRVMSAERSARPGLWSTDLVPYARAIMDAASDPAVQEIVFMKSAQVAGSEIANNIIGYYMHIEPSPILYVCETEAKAEAWSKESLAPMIRDTPALKNVVSDARGRDEGNTISAKTFPGGHLAISWATSAATLSSRPRRIVIFDEVDAFGTTTEGDPISLGEARTKTFPDRKIIKISTPRDDATSRILPAYNHSYAGKFFVPCPDCNEYQVLVWANVKWEPDNPLAAYYVCERCGVCIDHDSKAEMLATGEWRFGTITEEKDESGAITKTEWKEGGVFAGSVGFHIWEGYSPFVTWGEMAVNFLKKKKNISELKTFVNTSLAETWKENDTKIEVGDLPERCEDYGAEVPYGVLLLTAGCDVQGDRIEFEIVGHGYDQETWSINRGVLWGDPSQPKVWGELRAELTREFSDPDGRAFRVNCAAIDSGGHHTKEVYEFCRQNVGRKFFAVKGANTPGKSLISKPTLQGRPAVKLFTIGTETAKDTFSALLKVNEPGQGYQHFPIIYQEDSGQPLYNEEFFKQLVSEKAVVRPIRGVNVRQWVKIKAGIRNEALDCRVYALAAFAILNPNLRKIAENMREKAIEKPIEAQELPSEKVQKAPKKPAFIANQRKKGGFVQGWR